MEAAYGQELEWFFDEWIDTTGTLDYAIGEIDATHEGNGRWTVSVEVLRHGENWMPVELQVDGETRVLDSREPRQFVTFTLDGRPEEARLDPRHVLLDAYRDNVAKRFE